MAMYAFAARGTCGTRASQAAVLPTESSQCSVRFAGYQWAVVRLLSFDVGDGSGLGVCFGDDFLGGRLSRRRRESTDRDVLFGQGALSKIDEGGSLRYLGQVEPAGLA